MSPVEIVIYAAAAACMLFMLLYVIRVLFPKKAAGQSPFPDAKPSAPKTRIPCVLCGAFLEKGEKLHSKEIVRKDDSIIHMYGCPHCHGTNASRPRTCPVCKKQMGPEEYLIGRMWVRKNGKKHLHVAGCMRCARSLL